MAYCIIDVIFHCTVRIKCAIMGNVLQMQYWILVSHFIRYCSALKLLMAYCIIDVIFHCTVRIKCAIMGNVLQMQYWILVSHFIRCGT